MSRFWIGGQCRDAPFFYTQRDAALMAEVGNHEWTRINTNEETGKRGRWRGGDRGRNRVAVELFFVGGYPG